MAPTSRNSQQRRTPRTRPFPRRGVRPCYKSPACYKSPLPAGASACRRCAYWRRLSSFGKSSATVAPSSSSAIRVVAGQPVQLDLGALLQVRVERDPAHRPAPRAEVLGQPVQVDGAGLRPHRVDHRDRAGHQVVVAVRVQPVQRRRRAARPVHRAGRHDHQRVRDVQHALHGRVHQAGTAVGEHDVVEVLQQVDGAPVVVLAERLRHGRVLLAGQHLQPAGSLRGVRAHVAVAGDRGASRSRCRTVAVVSSGIFWLSVPRSGLASTAITRSPRSDANVEPSVVVVVVLPTPPFSDSIAIL